MNEANKIGESKRETANIGRKNNRNTLNGSVDDWICLLYTSRCV